MSTDLAARRRALDPASSFLVQAPAGSGKTSLLTQRFLRLLSLVEQPEEILAITFTRKAAAEMRNRILRELREADSGSPVTKEYERETRALAEAVLRRDRECDWQILASPSRLRVQTIDSFEASLVARLPWFSKLGFSPDSTDNAKPLYLAAVREALRQLAEAPPDDPRRASVVRLLNLYDNHLDRMVDHLAGLLARREEWVRALGHRPLEERGPAALRAALEQNIRRMITPSLESLAARVPRDRGRRLAELAQIAAENLERETGDDAGLRAIDGWPPATTQALPQWRALAWFLLTKDGELRKPGGINKNLGFPPAEKSAKQEMGALLEELARDEQFAPMLNAVRDLPDPFYTDAQWEVLEALLRFLTDVLPQLMVQFAVERKTDFKEISLRAASALEESPGVPTLLAERLDGVIRHILVDEFQDTSVLQVLLLQNLTAGWVPGDGRTLFAVGDPMQSIYEWRNARVDLFLRAWDGSLPALPPLEPLRLTRNFRSRRTLIETFNKEFDHHFPDQNNPVTGAVAYAPAEPDPQEADPETNRLQCHAFIAEGPQEEAARIAEEIARLQAEDAARAAETPSRSPRKVAVLFRAKKGAQVVSEALRARKIPYQAIDVDPLSALPVIQDLRSMLALLLSPEDRLSAFSVLRAPWNALRLTELEQVRRFLGEGSLWDILQTLSIRPDGPWSEDARLRVRRTVALFGEAFAWRGRRPAHQLLRRLWASTGAEAYHADARSRLAAAQFFRLLSGIEDAELLRGLEVFDEALAQLHAPPDPEAPDTLQLLTIHKAKGLEFDVVFVPCLNDGNARDPMPALAWEELPLPQDPGSQEVALVIAPKSAVGEPPSRIASFLSRRKSERVSNERNRLLYVAFTRAKEKLHLLATIKPKYAESEDAMKCVSGSYLKMLWPHFAGPFREALAARAAQPDLAAPVDRPFPPLRRMLPEALPALPATLPASADEGASGELVQPRDLFETAETAAGAVFHRLMERAFGAQAEQPASDALDRLRPIVRAELRALLPAEPAIDPLASRVLAAFERTVRSERARPLFDPGNRELRCEQSVGYWERGEWRVARIDRMFRDASGQLNIVDFKLVDAVLAGDGVEAEQAFRTAQRSHHQAQLEHYARLLQSRNAAPESVVVVLYYPLQDVVDTWIVEPLTRTA